MKNIKLLLSFIFIFVIVVANGLLIGTYRFIRLVRTEGQDAGIWFGRFKFSGLTCMIIGSTFYGISVKRFRKSINIYNNNLKKEHGLGAKDLELNFRLVDHGVGFSLNF